MTETKPQLSRDAQCLLDTLRRFRALTPDSAVTDKGLAHATGIVERNVIEVACELIAAGHLVCATTGKVPGRFLIEPGEPLEPARKYLAVLRSRSLAVFRRRRLVRLLIEKREREARAADSAGQFNMDFGAPPAAAARWKDQ